MVWFQCLLLLYSPKCTCILALTQANTNYSEKQQSGKCGEKKPTELAWKIKELSELIESGRKLLVDMNGLIEKLQDEQCNWVKENIPRRLATIRQRVVSFIRGTSRHKSTAASHVLVFMISPEERNRMPYTV